MSEQHSIRVAPSGPIHGRIRPPGSKSITNRALVCAALAEGESLLRGVLDSDDTRAMIDGLRQLGYVVEHDPAFAACRVVGHGPPRFERVDLSIGNSGTTARFLTALIALGRGRATLDGVERMRQRPIGDLIEALNRLGASIVAERGNGCPPLVIEAHGLAGGSASVRGDISSQFLSALLMAAPCAEGDIDLAIEGPLVSQPYVRMTAAVMAAFGAPIDSADLPRFHIAGRRRYRATVYDIEPDASAASYFWGAAAVTGGEVTVEGLTRDALQGDVAFCECLRRMGCEVTYRPDGVTVAARGRLRGVDVDMNAISDTAQTLAVAALFADGPTTIRGIEHNRHKETDRVGDLARELRKLGANVEEHDDGLTITPGPPRAARVETYDDHRMAMSFALAGLAGVDVEIVNPECTAKTYPRFFEDLARLAAASRS